MERDQNQTAGTEQPPAHDEAAPRTEERTEEHTQERPAGQTSPGSRPTPRPWSARRIPAALTALLIGAAAGTLLFDVVRVRAGESAATWRTRLADELASRPLDDTWMKVGAAVTAVLGLWLIILALTPGLRRKLPLKTPDGRLHAVLDRDAAELLLRDAAMRVPGVSAARVQVLHNRVTARTDVRFRAPADVKADLLAALREEIHRIDPARTPGLTVRVRPRRK
ncbi:DUF6286 domain-containing protein [Streptomyces sp. NPDC058655]|uniref:DUF6286 domain-containing protein n=1 Tax=unclassified Streptomyces TaxID=2593676 RepID=UPI003645FAC8